MENSVHSLITSVDREFSILLPYLTPQFARIIYLSRIVKEQMWIVIERG